ncbi:MAG: ribonuclease Z [Betaproteobacteria bacterium RIFCSPLOWO2_12_FULL_65_14]|nr:MAG: ribonuclease Z [Betaproteobacteria bacterium RIFCSPLOWO2_12_FULL_65_14]
MRPIVSAALVNGEFGDPALYLDFRDEKRALLFDLGDIGKLLPKKLLRLSDIFVSHAHMDHFAGLDRLLRVCLGRGSMVRLYGPPGFLDRVEHKLAAYTWNLVERYPGDFTLLAHELAPDWSVRAARFRASQKFARETLPEERAADGVLLDEPRFRVRAAFLDHGMPCLGFALEEKTHVNVWKNRLAEMGLPVGPWLNDLKRAVAEGLPDDTPIHGRTLGELKARALQLTPGQKIAYVTDIVYHAENEARVAQLAADADLLFIEAVFLSSEAEHAARKFHLTAQQAGCVARAARARNVVPFHFSPRYLGREAELRAEVLGGPEVLPPTISNRGSSGDRPPG